MSTRPEVPGEEPDDDEALSWAGDDARGQSAPRLRVASDPLVAAGSDGFDPDAAGAAAASAPRRTPAETALLVATGVFAGVYLAIAVGWILSVQLIASPYYELFGEIMWQFGEFLAMIAAVLWFGAVFALTPEGVSRRGLRRFVWLTIGVLVLLPWPFLLGAFS
ncbi:hypothetical protein [Protaetiibacter larvae]|uniref:DNA polymerase III subunit gamma/tau n=1 Tax=Protaetiibacter larvae TaxID=2592654 RepID=A0A5C1YB63_9MICO|nr:hypothetical protein [Protaetiibacter larvae]QEO10688.1 hypothetical protein FLP23_00005 [Protaetiibacter larvae]